ncbi:MAG: septal ring lytic transglycosylase RlpA family protein [Pigmentiphaga sp.]
MQRGLAASAGRPAASRDVSVRPSPHRPGHAWRSLAVVVLAVVLAACGTRQGSGPSGYPTGAGDYRRDGPHANPPANLHLVPDATPRIEPLKSGPNRPYVISGRRYVPDTSWQPYRARGRASWYGRQFHGRPTSSGEPYDMYAMTAAHPTLPIPSYVQVTHTANGRSVIVRINDRGPFVASRVIDLSYVAAHRLGTLGAGTGDVVVELITPDRIRGGGFRTPAFADSSSATVAPSPPATPAPVAALRTAETYASTETSAASNHAPTAALRVAGAQTGIAATQPIGAAPGASTRRSVHAAAPIPVPSAPPATTRDDAEALFASLSAPTAGGQMSSGAIYLQVGAFGQADNAQALARRLALQAGNAGLAQVQQSPDQLFRVRLGPYLDRQQALAEVETIYRQTGIMPHVIMH